MWSEVKSTALSVPPFTIRHFWDNRRILLTIKCFISTIICLYLYRYGKQRTESQMPNIAQGNALGGSMIPVNAL